jgi:hypothetical protein
MSRKPLELTPAQKAEVETLAAVLTAEQIADYFGIGRTTFFAMVDRDPEIAERYKRGKAKAIGAIAQSLITKARAGDTASMIFYLKTQAGWRETDRHEHVTSATVAVVGRHDSAHERLAAYIDGIAARQVGMVTTLEDGLAAASHARIGGQD